MKISVTYADQQLQFWHQLEVEEDTTVEEAIVQSGLLQRAPDIDLGTQKIGVFGKAIKLTHKLQEGERIEIYQPITADPESI